MGMDNNRIGDHRLDAMMLALAGLTLESSIYSNSGISDISIPEFFGKETRRGSSYLSPEEESNMIRDGLVRHRVPRAFNILKIIPTFPFLFCIFQPFSTFSNLFEPF